LNVDYTKFKDLDKLIDNTVPIQKSFEDFFEYDYFKSKSEALNMISEGYNLLPSVYHKTFLDPFKDLFTNFYDELIGYLKRSPEDLYFGDYFDVIYQKKLVICKSILMPSKNVVQMFMMVFYQWKKD
jgi:hypothetical protein